MQERMAQRPSLLIVSKDEASYEALRICMSEPGLTLHAGSAEAGQKILDVGEAPLILIELNSPGNIEALVRAALGYDADSQILVIAGASEEAMAARLMRLGACDILSRPVDPEIVRAATDRAGETYSLRRQLKRWLSGQNAPD